MSRRVGDPSEQGSLTPLLTVCDPQHESATGRLCVVAMAMARTVSVRRTTNPSAVWSLALSIAWVGGIGSLVGLVLGVRIVTKARENGADHEGRGPAYGGIVVGMAGLILASASWTHVEWMNSATSASYIDGSNFAQAQYPSATSEASLCVVSNAQTYDNSTQWLLGCRDGWRIVTYCFGAPGMPGLNVG